MATYYEILKVPTNASRDEIRSSYRRLARQLHPDRNAGSEETAVRFAEIAEAYEVLSNSRSRTDYDRMLLERTMSGQFDALSEIRNRHVRRWRQMVLEKRYNEIIDRMIAEERRETLAFQKAVYPVVGLLVSAVLAAALKPSIFSHAGFVGRVFLVTLFMVGVIHLFRRLYDAFVKYTDADDDIHSSILETESAKPRSLSRSKASAALLFGLIVCVLLGVLIGRFVTFPTDTWPYSFSRELSFEFILYPPIITLLVDLMHTIVMKMEDRAASQTSTGLR